MSFRTSRHDPPPATYTAVMPPDDDRDDRDDDRNDHATTAERLQKYLAHAGIASRRRAEELILAGAVSVNGAVVRELGTKVTPGVDEVRLRGKLVRPAAEEHVYLLLHKPADTVTTAYDPQGRPTVLDLLPPEYVARRVYPVGRLDRYTEGVLLLTDDGELALRLTHPRYALTKQYAALVRGLPTRDALRTLEHGMLLDGETRPTTPARAWIDRQEGTATWLGVELHEGRNRQVRRMLAQIGHPVLRLRRVRVGPLTLGGLAPGAYRPLTERELALLREAVGLGSV
jgi:23S rRNA pseudouridine2605 synthase